MDIAVRPALALLTTAMALAACASDHATARVARPASTTPALSAPQGAASPSLAASADASGTGGLSSDLSPSGGVLGSSLTAPPVGMGAGTVAPSSALPTEAPFTLPKRNRNLAAQRVLDGYRLFLVAALIAAVAFLVRSRTRMPE